MFVKSPMSKKSDREKFQCLSVKSWFNKVIEEQIHLDLAKFFKILALAQRVGKFPN